MPPFLYRGVSPEMHERLRGELRPKDTRPFVRAPEFGRAEFGNSFWGENEANAVVEHQQHQAGFPTSGVSTTPHKERAAYYATIGGTIPRGFIYIIDTSLLADRHVTAYTVNDIVPMPSVPSDDEVILVAADFGCLPSDLVVGMVACGS